MENLDELVLSDLLRGLPDGIRRWATYEARFGTRRFDPRSGRYVDTRGLRVSPVVNEAFSSVIQYMRETRMQLCAKKYCESAGVYCPYCYSNVLPEI